MMKFFIFSILLICLTFIPVRGQGESVFYGDTTLVQGSDEADLDYLFQKARSLTELGKDQAAILTYQEILKIDSLNEAAYIEVGQIAFRIGNWAYSNTLMSKLVALNPKDLDSRQVMMEVYRTFTVYTEEMKIVFELLQLNPSDTVLLDRLVTLYGTFDLHEERAEVLEYLIELKPQKREYYLQLADLYFNHLYKADKGLRTYERYLELQPEDVDMLSLLAFKYGEEDYYGKQIASYTQIHDLAMDTIYWQEALFQSYRQILRNYDLRFNVRKARDQCERFLEQRGERDDLRALYGGLESAAKPLINYKTALRGFDFAGRTTHWRNVLSIGFLGPFPGSSITVENNYSYIRQDYRPFIPGEYEPGMLESQLYQGRVMFDQRFSKLSMHVDAGIHQSISGPFDKKPHLLSTARVSYKPFENYSVSATYNLSTLTDNPVTIDQQIRRQRVLLGMQYSFLEDFMVTAGYQRGLLSDNNRHNDANIRLEYNIIQTLFRSDDLEARHPLGYNFTGTQMSAGIQYAYLDYTWESYMYPTVSNEQLASFFVLFEKQFIQSFVGRGEAFMGINNYRNLMWGYNLTLEKNISWRLNLFLQWDHFLAPYTIGRTHFTNSERTIQLGIISRF